MAKATHAKPKPAVKVRVALFDGPTPERMARDSWTLPNATLDYKTRGKPYFQVVVSGSVDQLYSQFGALTWAQWYSADRYRSLMQDGWPLPRVVGGYEPSIPAACDPSPVPLSDKAEAARTRLADIRKGLSPVQIGTIERALANEQPLERGRARIDRLDALRLSLDALARALGVLA